MAVHIAAVHTPAEVCFLTAAETAAELEQVIADYVRRNADDRLWPFEASQVHALLDVGEIAEATQLYFASVGTRWDEETLVTSVVELATATPGPVGGVLSSLAG